MIAYAIVLLTAAADIQRVERIEVQVGTKSCSLDGDTVRAFINCTNHAYHDFPSHDCLAYGLELIPPELREIFAYLYETLKEVFIWNEPDI